MLLWLWAIVQVIVPYIIFYYHYWMEMSNIKTGFKKYVKNKNPVAVWYSVVYDFKDIINNVNQ